MRRVQAERFPSPVRGDFMERSKKIVQISLIGIVVNLVLVAFKAAVGAITGAIAIIMDAVNNLSDALTSVITIVGTNYGQLKRTHWSSRGQ